MARTKLRRTARTALEGASVRITSAADMRVAAASPKRKVPTFSLVAYTGGVMCPAWPPVNIVVDLEGSKAARGDRPLLLYHDARKPLGQGPITIDSANNRVLMAGRLSGPQAHVADVVEAGKNGFPWKASMEGTLSDIEFVDKGETAQANGRSFRGPVYIARKSELVSVSIVTLAGDDNTSTKIAAAHGGFTQELEIMAKKRITTTTAPRRQRPNKPALIDPEDLDQLEAGGDEGDEVTELTPDETRRRRQRVVKLVATADDDAGELELVAEEYIAGRMTDEAFERVSNAFELARIRDRRPKMPLTAGGSRQHGSADDRQVMLAGLLSQTGNFELAAKRFGEQTAEAGREAFPDFGAIMAGCLRLDGIKAGPSADQQLRAAASSVSLQYMVDEYAKLIILQQFALAAPVYPDICGIHSLVDFKDTKVLRPVLGGVMRPVAASGEIKHYSVEEELKSNLSLNSYGGLLRLTRKDLINGAAAAIMEQTARAIALDAIRAINDSFASTLLSNADDFFGEAHANLLTGSSSVLQVSSLADAIIKMRRQTDADGRSLDIAPATLLVCPELEPTGRSILASQELARYVATAKDQQPTGNPFANGQIKLAVENRLSNANLSGSSTTAWYLFGPTMYEPMLAGFLNGNQSPTIEFFGLDAEVSTLAVAWRVFWDWGFSYGEHRAAVKSAGA